MQKLLRIRVRGKKVNRDPKLQMQIGTVAAAEPEVSGEAASSFRRGEGEGAPERAGSDRIRAGTVRRLRGRGTARSG